ncbi:MAG TPA: hypothetical protein VFR76_01055, partial [Verrucomicrobiae bacterium]|nr:hypothetical protein [Verrucomicrobiae bacterium]
PAAAAAGGAVEANRALGVATLPGTPAPADDGKARLLQHSQPGQFIAGKNFYQNNEQWVDTEAQKFQNAKRQRLQFNSSEYFAFAAKEPRALPYLSLGQEVQFVLDGTVYEITK